MNAWIRASLVIGALALLPAASASATPPKAEDLPPGSGLLIPPGGENPGPTYRFEPPPRFPGQLPPTVPPGMLKKRGEPNARPLPRPLLRPLWRHPVNRPVPPRVLPLPLPQPRPFSPVIPLPPPRGAVGHTHPWPAPPPLNAPQPARRPMNLLVRPFGLR